MNDNELKNPTDIAESYNEETDKIASLIPDCDSLTGVDDFVNAVSTATTTAINEPFQPRNRAERRVLDKATRRQRKKKKKMYVDSIKEATTKLAYIDMIQKVRELNEKIKEEGEKENEATN